MRDEARQEGAIMSNAVTWATPASDFHPSSLIPHPSPAVVCRGVTKEFGSGDAPTRALRGVDLEVRPGQLTLLVGPSGCGKTTLISIVAGLLEPTQGDVLVWNASLPELSPR